ncbi:MAG TPA: hypothetical protein VK741_00685 [Acetobacteraceae bacterium]|nr:hypothetical protein [Acetobacteraceae bacterium]
MGISACDGIGKLAGTGRWFVLRPSHVRGFANPQDAERQFNDFSFTLPRDDVAVRISDSDTKRVPDDLLLPLDPTHRVKKWQFRDRPYRADSEEVDLAKIILSTFTLPLVYHRFTVYLLSSAITDGGGDNGFALARFTPELKLEVYCLLTSTYELSSSTPNPTAP